MLNQQATLNEEENKLEQQALLEFNAGHYKEATELYKLLWENFDDKKWQQPLAYCYLKRAQSFAKREMFREVFIQWEQYTQYAEQPYQAFDQYICWKIQDQDSQGIETALKQLTADQLDKQYPELAAILGYLILTTHPEFQRYLPADSSFITHLKQAETALQAYLDNNKQQLNTVLKQLPYRSAFKDFRLLLNIAQDYPQSIEQGLAKLADNSPYFSVLNLMQLLALDGAKLVKRLAQFNYEQTHIVIELKGLTEQQGLIEALIDHHNDLTEKIKFDLLIQYQRLWEPGEVEAICKALLVSYPAGHKGFNKHFSALNSFETSRLKALACESIDNQQQASEYWRYCVEILQAESVENDLKIALILRRMAELQDDADMRNDLLIESLDYDVEDFSTYQQILQYFSHYEQDSAEYKQWLQDSLTIFPQNTELLSLALQSFAKHKDYQQASHYAWQILAIDPLHSVAKETLFAIYLEQARGFIRRHEFSLVEQAIKKAEELKLGQKYSAQAQLIRGISFFANEHEKQGAVFIVEALNKLHSDPVNAYFHGAIEALMAGLSVASILQGLEPAEDFVLSAQQLSRVIQQFKTYSQDFEHQLLLLKAIEKINANLKLSLSQQDYDESLVLSLAQTLEAVHAYDLLRICAELAVNKWTSAIWPYYLIYARNNGQAARCSDAQIKNLENIPETGVNDERVKVLIGNFLEQYYQAHSETSKGLVDNLFSLTDEIDDEGYLDPTDELFKNIPDDALLKLTNKADELMMETTPEQLIEDLTGAEDKYDNEQILLVMMQNPDLFSTLMMLKAAKVLAIEINLDIDDVLGFFDQQS